MSERVYVAKPGKVPKSVLLLLPADFCCLFGSGRKSDVFRVIAKVCEHYDGAAEQGVPISWF